MAEGWMSPCDTETSRNCCLYKRKIRIFNFGKYKGMSVSDVLKRDPGYYSWILNSDFTLNTKATLTKIRLREMTQK